MTPSASGWPDRHLDRRRRRARSLRRGRDGRSPASRPRLNLRCAVPGDVLARANQMLRSAPMMVTALVGIYDPRTSIFTYASAGHPPPLVIAPDGHAFMLPNGDLPLGVIEDLAPTPWTFTLSPGTLLVLYTDGIVEFERDVFLGESALISASIDELADLSAHPARSVQDRVFGSKGQMSTTLRR